MTHFCSLGVSAGRKKPSVWKMIMGQHTITAKKAEILKRSVKPPSADVT